MNRHLSLTRVLMAGLILLTSSEATVSRNMHILCPHLQTIIVERIGTESHNMLHATSPIRIHQHRRQQK